jgi:hypothetical protein
VAGAAMSQVLGLQREGKTRRGFLDHAAHEKNPLARPDRSG